jgi:predicted Zn-dependent peptidase
MQDWKFTRTQLDNGLRVIAAEQPGALSVAVRLFVAVGSRYEPENLAGISHFLEHMVFKGTKKRPTARQISEAIEGMGGQLNAATGFEYTNFYAKVTPEHLETAVDVVSDLVLNPLLDPAELEREKGVIQQEISRYEDQPETYVSLLFQRLLFPEDPLGRPIIGYRQTVAGVSREDMLGFLDFHYRPQRAVLVGAGRLEAGQLVELAGSYLGEWSPGPERPEPELKAVDGGPRVVVGEKPTNQVHINLGVRAYSLWHPDRFAAMVMNSILGEGMSSRLFLNVRERLGLAYSVYSYVAGHKDTGQLVIYAGLDPSRFDLALTTILTELDRLRQERVPADELARGKERQKVALMFQLERSENLSAYYGVQETVLGQVMTPQERLEHIEAVTADDVLRVAQDLFRTERLRLSLVGLNRPAEELEAKLEL